MSLSSTEIIPVYCDEVEDFESGIVKGYVQEGGE